MKVGIVASDRREWHVQRLTEELEGRGAEAYMLPATRFLSRVGVEPRLSVRGYSIDDYDAVIVRKVPGGTAGGVLQDGRPAQAGGRGGLRDQPR